MYGLAWADVIELLTHLALLRAPLVVLGRTTSDGVQGF